MKDNENKTVKTNLPHNSSNDLKKQVSEELQAWLEKTSGKVRTTKDLK